MTSEIYLRPDGEWAVHEVVAGDDVIRAAQETAELIRREFASVDPASNAAAVASLVATAFDVYAEQLRKETP